MEFVAPVALTTIVTCGVGILYRRVSLISLRWPKGLLNKQIAQRCQAYLALYGIKTVSICYFYADFAIRTDNLKFPVGSLVFCCMDEQYIAGTLCFTSMREQEARGRQDADVQKYPDIWILLTTSEVKKSLVVSGESFGIPVLHSTDLKDLAFALSKARDGTPLKYEGKSLLLQTIIEERLGRSIELNATLEAARRSQAEKDWGDAEKHWRSYLSMVDRPNYQPEAKLGLASALGALGRFAESDEIFRQAISDNPEHVGLLEGYAKSANSRGDCREALSRWNRVINTFPEKWCGYSGKVATLFELGEKDTALSLLRTESMLRRNSQDAAHDSARWAERLGNWVEAEAAWRRFIRLNNKRYWAFKDLARALAKQGKVLEAEKILVGARRRFPGENDLVLDIGD